MDKPFPLQIFENLQQDPHSIFVDGQIALKSYTVNQGGYSISVSDSEAVNYLIGKMSFFYEEELDSLEKESIKIISSLQRQLENEKNKYETLSRNLKNEHDVQLEKYEKALEENKKYIEWYGTLVSPILIIKELWNEALLGELDMLVNPSNWKTGKGLGGDAGTAAKRYWISMFMEWKMIKQWGKGKYMANMGMYEALELLNKMMKQQGLIPEEMGINNEQND